MFSFTKRKGQDEVRDLLQRLTNMTTPNLPPVEGESRAENRYNRTLPVLVAPWNNGDPCVEEATTALTKDCSDRGLALVLHEPFHVDSVVIALVLNDSRSEWAESQTVYALGQVRQNSPLGGGYWQLGIELTQRTDPGQQPNLCRLTPLIKRLIPDSLAATLPDAESVR